LNPGRNSSFMRQSVSVVGQVLGQLEWGALRLARGRCPLCAGRLFLRFSNDPLGVRCLGCRASAISMAIGSLLVREAPRLCEARILELSARGPLHAHLERQVAAGSGALTGCEYFDDVEPGAFRDGVQCQDVQALSYADESFDLCTHTEVFEHIPDDARGFAEIHRVLVPGGLTVFTVPIDLSLETLERARLEGDGVVHLVEPSYHDDVIRGAGKVMVYRDYGRDLTARLAAAGFVDAQIVEVDDPAGLGTAHPVVVAHKRRARV
jgi:SAM-dependent methyltransferase